MTTMGGQVEAVGVQTCGFIILAGGYVYLELRTLAAGEVAFSSGERCVRLLLVLLVALSGACFLGAPMAGDATGLCCDDVYLPVNMTVVHTAQGGGAFSTAARDLELMEHHAAHPDAPYPLYLGLYDTATDQGRQLKLLRFWGQVCALLCVLLSHLAIWLFCPERLIEVPRLLQADEKDDIMLMMERTGSRPGRA